MGRHALTAAPPLLATAAAALAIAGTPGAAQAQADEPLIAYLGGADDWHAFRSTVDGVATCYMVTMPTGEEATPPGTFAMLALGPEDEVWRVAFRSGRADLSDVELDFQNDQGDSVDVLPLQPGESPGAWTIPTAQSEAAEISQETIVARMNEGFQMAFKASGEALATYSLLGIQNTKMRVMMEESRCPPG